MRRRIVGARLPEPAAAGFPRARLVLPRLASRIARFGDGVPPPELVAGTGIQRRDPAARLAVACSVGNDDLTFGGNGCREEFFAAAEFVRHGDHLVPDDFAVVALHGNHAAVGEVGDDQVFPQRAAARAGDVALVIHAGVGHPDELALIRVARVDLINGAPAVGRIHEAVVDEGIHFVFGAVLSDVLHAAQGQRPDQPEIFHVVAIHLRQLRVAR